MITLALGGVGATYAVTLFAVHYWLALSRLDCVLWDDRHRCWGFGYIAIGFLATATAADRRAAAATITWLMMIFGIALTAGVAGQFLDPYSPQRLMAVVSVIALLAIVVTVLAIWNIERAVSSRSLRTGHSVSRSFARGVGGIQNAEFYNFRLSVNECVFHAGIDP